MGTILNLFEQLQLAEAAYANLVGMTVSTSPEVLALALTTGDGKFSKAQATDFVNLWSVVDQYTAPAGLFGLTDGTGFSATLFHNKDTGAYTYAIRGTQPGYADIGDIVADGIVLDHYGVSREYHLHGYHSF